jgi:hypothetical protein
LANNEEDPEGWTLDVLIKPTEKMILIVIVDAFFLLILGLIIIILHLYEKVRILIFCYLLFRLKIGKISMQMCQGIFEITKINVYVNSQIL